MIGNQTARYILVDVDCAHLCSNLAKGPRRHESSEAEQLADGVKGLHVALGGNK